MSDNGKIISSKLHLYHSTNKKSLPKKLKSKNIRINLNGNNTYLENILNLGNIGDKVKVKNGYGRNFLLKEGKALRFNKENQEFVNKKKDELNKRNIEK